ncbi:uncharacterized protein LOC125624889 [Caretta caretta]|uniref:uncharacterized protein LOC125624889 n=1 Tax=Caretta caretta TaxID=8467 RepID=UPI003F4CA346
MLLAAGSGDGSAQRVPSWALPASVLTESTSTPLDPDKSPKSQTPKPPSLPSADQPAKGSSVAKSRRAGKCRELAGDTTAPGCRRSSPRQKWTHLQDRRTLKRLREWVHCALAPAVRGSQSALEPKPQVIPEGPERASQGRSWSRGELGPAASESPGDGVCPVQEDYWKAALRWWANDTQVTDSEPHAANMLDSLVTLVGAGIGAGVAFVGIPVVVGAVGFTGAGIAAGSIAAKMMSAAAIANGGGVAAGSAVATLQSIGAAGLPVAAKAVMVGVGAAASALF